MNRREFMERSMLGTGVASVLTSRGGTSSAAAENAPVRSRQGTSQASLAVTAGDIHEYLRSLGDDWVDPKRTVDTFKAGKPETAVKGIAVGWMSYFKSLRRAHELGCNLFITHEPTYYDHRDRDESVFAFETARKKKEFIEKSEIAIIRCHDVWDRVPEIGIRDAWARFLGLDKELPRRIAGDRSEGSPFCGVYEIAPIKAQDFAQRVAGKLARYRQDAVLLIGPEDRVVRTVAVGTGAITPFRQMVNDLEADIVICSDDGFSFWRDGSLALDMEYPAIVVNHPCSEEIGMQKLAEHLAGKLPRVPVHHIAQTCMFKSIRGRP